MKTINKNELFEHLSGFLKSKGIELKEGTYSKRIQQGCNLLADTVNATQKTVKRAKVVADENLDRLRQSIHEATAPKPAAPPPAPESPASAPAAGDTKKRPSQRKTPSVRAKPRRHK
jgi:hypothetical protein